MQTETGPNRKEQKYEELCEGRSQWAGGAVLALRPARYLDSRRR